MSNVKNYKIIVSDRAVQMLDMHIRFIAKVNKPSAIKKKNELLGGIKSLSNYPERYPFLDEMFISKNKYHKMYIEKYYLIIYQIKDDIVYVDYILDCRKDYNWLVK